MAARTGYSPPTPTRSNYDADMSGSSGLPNPRAAKSRRGRSREPSDTDSDVRIPPRGSNAQTRARTLAVPQASPTAHVPLGAPSISTPPQKVDLSSMCPSGSRTGGGTQATVAECSGNLREADGIRDPQGARLIPRQGPGKGKGQGQLPESGILPAAGFGKKHTPIPVWRGNAGQIPGKAAYPHAPCRGNAGQFPAELVTRSPNGCAESMTGTAAQLPQATVTHGPTSCAESMAGTAGPEQNPPIYRGSAR